MTIRRMNLESLITPDPQVNAWFEANGIDPRNVPVAQEISISDDSITLVQFIRNAGGHFVINGDHIEKELVTVPMVSPLEDHGL